MSQPGLMRYTGGKDDRQELVDSYREITRRSRFVLCPRGPAFRQLLIWNLGFDEFSQKNE